MSVAVDTTTNMMTVSSTSTLNENLIIPINLVAVLLNSGRLNCNFYYPLINIRMVGLTHLIPPSLSFYEVRFDPYQSIVPSY